ncbi:hypothetical protein AB833_27710 [Chromatiales bacterium (ex Bugula neritina AB1)]|nr:hypothetical protein AB833_27710 [Chromatiales bacterium (ex Bugula neritina AB1)]
MLSRVAENVYWLSRYLERIENTARLIKIYGRSLMDLPDVEEHEGWMPLISISGLDAVYLEHFNHASEADVISFLIADTRNPGSLLNAATAIKTNLRSSRDIFPKRMYEKISTLVRFIRNVVDRGITTTSRDAFLDAIERQVLEISGAVHGSLRHDQAYKFMRMASYIERADMTSRVLDVPSSVLSSNPTGQFSPFENRHWTGALQSLSAMQMYRRHVRQPVNAEGCLNFLLNDEQLPGACRFCLVRLDRCLQHFKYSDAARAEVDQLLARLTGADVPTLATDSAARHDFLDRLQLGLLATGDAIAETYFPPAQEPA